MSDKTPKVALETTLLCHGVPRTRALAVARSLDEIVRSRGAEPVLVGVVDGRLRVGLSLEELERLLEREHIEKIGARGIAGALARKVCAATTVSATMAIAADAGIAVFATGGIGGVHRNAEHSFDESEDLAALARYPVAVVSAGAKAILDLPKTVERLETLGVPVVAYKGSSFTAFYTNASLVAAPERIDDVDILADLVRYRLQGRFGTGGVLVVNRVPDAVDIGADAAQQMVEAALAHADAQGAHGAAATPTALAYINAQMDGRFLDTNIAVVESNAAVAADLAVALLRGRA